MTDFKVGDKVVLSRRFRDGYYTITNIGDTGVVRSISGSNVDVILDKNGRIGYWKSEDADLVNTTVYVHKTISYERKVLGSFTNRNGNEYLVIEDQDDGVMSLRLKQDLEDDGWAIKSNAPEVKEVTLSEIAEKFNVSVDQIRVKE